MSSNAGLFLVLFTALTLFGAGCKSNAPAPAVFQDTPDAATPEGWQTYRNEEDGYKVAYPPTWGVDEDGVLYKDAPNLEQLLQDSQGHFDSVAQVAPASIGVAVFDPEGKNVDELWGEQTAQDPDTDRVFYVDQEYGRIGHCTGIRYYECLFTIHRGQAYTITMVDHGIVWSDNPETQLEIERILDTFEFLR